jgi:hypothetical protein
MPMKVKFTHFYCFIFAFSICTSAQLQVTNNCVDTTERNLIFLNSDTSITVSQTLVQNSGNSMLLGAAFKSSNPSVQLPLIAKFDSFHIIQWTALLALPGGDSTLTLLHAIELTDQSTAIIAACSYLSNPVQFHFVLIRLDPAGNINSYQAFKSLSLPYPVTSFYNARLCELENNSLALVINLSSNSISNQLVVAKIDAANNIVWSNAWIPGQDHYDLLGIMKTQRGFILAGKFGLSSGNCSAGNNKGHNLVHFNGQDGHSLSEKAIAMPV